MLFNENSQPITPLFIHIHLVYVLGVIICVDTDKMVLVCRNSLLFAMIRAVMYWIAWYCDV